MYEVIGASAAMYGMGQKKETHSLRNSLAVLPNIHNSSPSLYIHIRPYSFQMKVGGGVINSQ